MMKKLALTLYTLLLLLTGCMSSYVNTANRRLIDIPTVAHDRTVDIYLQSEMPEKDYIKIEILENKALESESTSELIYGLGQEASLRGYDGLILLGEQLSTIVEDDESFLETVTELVSGEEIPDNFYSTTFKHITAVGIIYKDNLSYLDKVPKAEQLLDPYGNLLATIDIDYRGQPQLAPASVSRNTRLYLTNFYHYTTTHLLDEESDHWKYQQEGQFVSKRSYVKENTRNKVCAFRYDKERRVSQVTIKNTYPQRFTEVVDFIYDGAGRLVEQRIVSNYRTRIIDYHYVNDRLLSKQIWELKDNEKKLQYQTNVIHYDNKDIDSLMQMVSATRH